MLDYLTELPSPEPSIVAVDDLIEDLQKTTDLQINWQGPTSLNIDKMMIHRLLFNLARNARQAGATTLAIDIWQAGHSRRDAPVLVPGLCVRPADRLWAGAGDLS